MAQACFGALNDECLKSLGIQLDQLHDRVIEESLSRTLESMEAVELQVHNLRHVNQYANNHPGPESPL